MKNLNEVCSFKGSKSKTYNISPLIVNNKSITTIVGICNELNNYFSTVGEKLVNDLVTKHKTTNNFQSYLKNSQINSVFCAPVDNLELLKIFASLSDRKSPGPDNIGPKLVKQSSAALINPLLHIYLTYLLLMVLCQTS